MTRPGPLAAVEAIALAHPEARMIEAVALGLADALEQIERGDLGATATEKAFMGVSLEALRGLLMASQVAAR